MNADFRIPSPKEVIVLELLAGVREMYGLEMVKASSQLGRGTIYVLLNRMEDRGLISSRRVKEPNSPGMPLRIYSITGLGQQSIRAWRNAAVAFSGVQGDLA